MCLCVRELRVYKCTHLSLFWQVDEGVFGQHIVLGHIHVIDTTGATLLSVETRVFRRSDSVDYIQTPCNIQVLNACYPNNHLRRIRLRKPTASMKTFCV